jgi:hypothetical protein
MPAPKFTVLRGDHHELVELSRDNPETVLPIDQLVIIDSEKIAHPIRVFPEMSAEALKAKVRSLNLPPGSTDSYLYVVEALWPKYSEILKEAFPACEAIGKTTQEVGVHTVKVRITFKFSSEYWRAIAKIAFHYYLVNSKRGLRGDEPEFADLRQMILTGGDHTPFFRHAHTQFVMPFRELPGGRAFLPRDWAHVLAVDEFENAPIVMVSLFAGPKRLPRIYNINLGKFRSPLVVPGARYGHVYMYDSSPENGFVGHVEPISLIKLR